MKRTSIPLLHLRSLGIEELAWPLILMLAARVKLSLLWVAGAIGFASFALNVALIDSSPVVNLLLAVHPCLGTAGWRRARLLL